jgi:hypothetical protein
LRAPGVNNAERVASNLTGKIFFSRFDADYGMILAMPMY